jgi:hypothetical protein
MCPVLPPTERQVSERLLVQGVAVEDVLKLTVADIKHSVDSWLAFRRQKGPSKDVKWTPAWLKHEVIRRQEAEWQERKDAEIRELAEAPSQMQEFLDGTVKRTGGLEQTRQWNALPQAERVRRMREVQAAVGMKLDGTKATIIAMNRWWENENG